MNLFLHDLHTTTDVRPNIDVRHDAEFGLIVSYNGGYTTPAMHSIRNPEATREIADYLQAEVHDDISRVWPTCSTHNAGLHAEVSGDQAVWYCRRGEHALATIGQLASS